MINKCTPLNLVHIANTAREKAKQVNTLPPASIKAAFNILAGWLEQAAQEIERINYDKKTR